MNAIKEIYEFECPMWIDLPEEPLFNQEAVNYINQTLKPIIREENFITTTMVQNYIKLGFLPRPAGRKYKRIHIAYLIVISIYKQILNIKEVRKGVELQLTLMDLEKAYNLFSKSLNKAIRDTFESIHKNKTVEIQSIKAPPQRAGVDVIAYSFSFRLLGTIILNNDGFKNLGGKNEQNRNNS